MAPRVLVVLNPSAHDFEAKRRWPKLEEQLARHGRFRVLETSPDDQETQRRIGVEAKQDVDRIVTIGGDGTLHLVINGLMQAELPELPELAIVPFGTANNVAKSYGLPLNKLEPLAEIAMGEHTAGLDIGRAEVTREGGIEVRWFIDSVTVGMDADVLAARGKFRDLKGYLSYLPALAERALEQRSLDVRITCDDEKIDTRLLNLVINNVPVYVGELRMPQAKADDGLLDVYMFNRKEYVSKIMSFAIKKTDLLDLGMHELVEEITENQRERHGRHIQVRLASPRRVQVDGELFGATEEVDCRIETQARILVP